MHPTHLEKEKCALVVVDMQEAFRASINDFALVASRISVAVRGFQILEIPVIVTEQYPKGLGKTAEEIFYGLAGDVQIIEKTAFSAYGASEFREKLNALNASQIILCGIETHICVGQTAHDLLAENFQVHLLTDCTASRFAHDKQAGIAKMLAGGAISGSAEMAFFELMRDSKHAHFKEIQQLIK